MIVFPTRTIPDNDISDSQFSIDQQLPRATVTVHTTNDHSPIFVDNDERATDHYRFTMHTSTVVGEIIGSVCK